MKNLLLEYSYQITEGGVLVKDSGILPCHSFTKNMGALLMITMGGVSTIVNTGGTSYDYITGSWDGDTRGRYQWSFTAGSGSTAYGILVGTGNTSPTINDYAMETLIANGAGAGQLQYGATTVGSPSATATTATFRTSRVMTNSSGGSINVEEIGLANYIQSVYETDTGTSRSTIYILLIRDVTGGIAVANGQSCTINYDLTTTI